MCGLIEVSHGPFFSTPSEFKYLSRLTFFATLNHPCVCVCVCVYIQEWFFLGIAGLEPATFRLKAQFERGGLGIQCHTAVSTTPFRAP